MKLLTNISLNLLHHTSTTELTDSAIDSLYSESMLDAGNEDKCLCFAIQSKMAKQRKRKLQKY